MHKVEQILQNSITKQAKSSCKQLSEEETVKRDVDILNSLHGNLKNYDCKKCKNKGVIYSAKRSEFYSDEYWEVVSRNCDCLKIRTEMQKIKDSGLSKLMKRYSFENYNVNSEWQKCIKEKAIEYLNNPVGWFYIGGQSGSGKTHICTAIVGVLLKEGRAARYMLWGDEITAIKQAVIDSEQYDKLLNTAKNAEILYIDDFFKTRSGESPSKADVDTTFKIINYRYNEQLPTLISSELSIKEISNIDEALAGRIAEMSKPNAIYITKDKRKNQRFYG